MSRFWEIGPIIITLLVSATTAHAATITFVDWSQSGSDTVIPAFTVSDDPVGKFKVSVDVSPSSPNMYGEITGIYFDLQPNLLIDADITDETVGGGTTHTDFATNATGISGVTNLNLGVFDYILGYKDGSDKGEVPIMFFVSDKGGTITLDDWDRVGVRWQVVGADFAGDGSDKEVSMTATAVSPVPLPAAAWLFASVLGVFGYLGKRKAKA